MGLTRQCSKTGCTGAAVATLTYVYRDSTVVLGPLATYAEPHTYDLCARHADRLTVPRGWEVVRLSGDYVPPPPTSDDLGEGGADPPRDVRVELLGDHPPHVVGLDEVLEDRRR